MNFKLVIRQLAILVLLVGVCMSSSLIWGFMDRKTGGEAAVFPAFFMSVGVCFLLGGVFFLLTRQVSREDQMYRKEAIAVVGLGWILCGLLGALPYVFSGVLEGLYDNHFDIIAAAIFESVSGFTTTGASIFPEPELLPRAVLFWRSLTHWLGGMGIIVLFVAILGQTGSGAKFLVSSEVPGPITESIRPRIRQTALLLWKIYMAISLIEVVCLSVQGMDIFESLCHTFGTMATGGFSTKNASIGQYNNLGYEITIIVFMLLAGTNFNLYASLIQGRVRDVFRNKEFRVYVFLLFLATLFLTIDLVVNRSESYTFGRALRSAGFQSVSIMTTTGYGTDDFNQWPSFSRWLLTMLMFVGGSAGSTGGGIKVIRFILFFRVILMEVEYMFRPSRIRPFKMGGQILDDDVRRNVSAYIGLALVIFFIATFFLMILHNEAGVAPEKHLDLDTAFTAVIATLNNIGPGLNMVGPMANYAFFTAPGKLLLTLLMILGRLEIMVILCLFVPGFWRKD